MNEEEVRIAKETLEALFSDSTGEDYPYTEKFVQAVNTGIQALEELEQYRALGTVEELKESREKQIPKKPKDIDEECGTFVCPSCESIICSLDDMTVHQHCLICGQKLDWEEGGTSD